MIKIQKTIKEDKVRKFFSVVLAVLVMAAGFAALPANAEANEAVVSFGQPKVVASPEVAVTLRDEFSFGNFRAYIFTLKNNSSDPAHVLSGFGSEWKYGLSEGNPVFYQWWTLLISPTGERETNSQEFILKPGGEYTLSLTVEVLEVRGNAKIFPFLNQHPALHDVKFRLSDGTVYVNWKSTGNFSGEAVKMSIWRISPNTLVHFALLPALSDGHSIGIETFPEGEYYITYSFSSDDTIYSPLYYSPGPGQ